MLRGAAGDAQGNNAGERVGWLFFSFFLGARTKECRNKMEQEHDFSE